jgi:hypothetical protein
MPLHADNPRARFVFDHFDHTVGCATSDSQPWRNLVERLMMK